MLEMLTQVILQWGPLGLFAASIFANASIVLPVPIDIVVFWLGSSGLMHPLLVGILAGAGAAIGEMTAYILGMLGIKLVEKKRGYEVEKINTLRNRIKNKGMIFIAAGAFTPFPFDLIGIAAGLIKYDPKKFFIAALVGKLLRYIIIAYAGVFSWGAVQTIFAF